MVKLDEKMWGIFQYVKKAKVWERILGGTENIGRNESLSKLLIKIWEGKRENRDLPNNKLELFFKQWRVHFTGNICQGGE